MDDEQSDISIEFEPLDDYAEDPEEIENAEADNEPSSARVEELNSHLVRFICSEALSFDIIESESFRNLIQTLDPSYVAHLPTRQILVDKLVPELYEELRLDVRTQLLQSASRAVTVDLWTNARSRTYMSVLVHWLDGEFNSHHKCLAVKRVPRSHTVDSLAAQFNEVKAEWSLDQSGGLHVVVSGPSVMKESINKVTSVTSRPCFGEAIQHCISTALGVWQVSELAEVLAKCRSISDHFWRTIDGERQLKSSQEELGLPQKKLKLDCADRWNSTVTMLERLLQQRDAVCHAVISSSSRSYHDVQNLSPEQWTTASQLMSTLRPFVEVVDLMSTMFFPPLSLIVPAVDGLRRALCELTEVHDGLRDVLLDLINENFGAVFDDDELCAAAVVDPRFKLLPFSSERTNRKATDATVALMEHVLELPSASSQSASSVSTESSPALQTLNSAASTFPPVHVGSHTSDASSFIPTSMLLYQQLAAYASEAVIPRTDCPLTWWADNWQKYPLVFEVVRRLLVIPAVTVSTERLYTKKGDEFMDKRDAMSPEKADQVLFIMENL